MSKRGPLRDVLDEAGYMKGRKLTRSDFKELKFTDDVPSYERRAIVDELCEASEKIAKLAAEGAQGPARQKVAELTDAYAEYFADGSQPAHRELPNSDDPRALAAAVWDDNRP